jgi:beta-phosphoglucomutase-like phosphatase (HAD superfamily)
MQQSVREEIETRIRKYEALQRLKSNKDFKLVIGSYLNSTDKVNQLSYSTNEDSRKLIVEELVSIANLNNYFEEIVLKAEDAKNREND